jgi:magnesium chelatase subunit D
VSDTRPATFPFPALVGLDDLKMALQLAAVDRRLSVLIRGDKGAGKSTAARSLVDVLADGAPFVNLPIGATDDRLLGGLDVEKALKGEPALKRGLLGDAHGGVLYVDEVNLLPDHLADALLDAVATGVHVVEREGFSATQAADFVLIGSMNPEEGALRPQLLDRFAFAVDVVAPMDPAVRRDVIERRLAYDADPAAFNDAWQPARVRLARQLEAARARLLAVQVSAEILDLVAARIANEQVRSLRADLAVVRGSRALAALDGAAAVNVAHVDAVLPLALAHRTIARPRNARMQTLPPRQSERPDDTDPPSAAAAERVFAPVEVSAPKLAIQQPTAPAGASSESAGARRGVAIGARLAPEPQELDVRATVVHAVTHTGAAAVRIADLHERIRIPIAGTRYLFVVDSSGSHAAHERMRFVKGAVGGLLDHARPRDEVSVIVCRGAEASVVVEPTTAHDDVRRALEYLPTGGRTPLAHALELAAMRVTDGTVIIVLTDGHANVGTRSDDAWADALSAAAAIRCPALVIDSEDERYATGRPRQLADAMRAACVRLSDVDETSVLPVIRGRS